MFILGDIGNSETKICLVNKNDQILNGNEGIPIIKVLTDSIADATDIIEDPDFAL